MRRITVPPKKSIKIPNIIPKAVPIFAPEYNPINNINIINIFGIIPEIVNQLKKFNCKKYIMINVINNNITVTTFFTYFIYSFLRLLICYD